jgi:hypothetical protein
MHSEHGAVVIPSRIRMPLDSNEACTPHFHSPYTRRTMVAYEDEAQLSSLKLNWETFAGVGVVSAVYLADVFLKASQKCFWFDELFTVYLCRLPNFQSTWTAVKHGADFNPPLFYLLTRGAQWLFGEGLIATRLPAMLGLWLFSICLFLFVGRRAGVLCASIAGMFPFLTLAQYYAYEARAHGIVLGWCGLALVCWQRNAEGRAKHVWAGGFGLSLTCALLTHVYAVLLLVPFAVIELYNLLRGRGVNWGIVGTMTMAFTFVTLFIYLPLARTYKTAVPPTFFPGSHDLLQRFLVNVIGPAMIVLLLLLLLAVIDGMRRDPRASEAEIIPEREVVLAVAFIFIPLVGLIGAKVSHGPFFDRYFLSSIAGYAILFGFASSSRLVSSWAAKALAGFMFFLMFADLGTTAYFCAVNRIMLFEPSTGFRLSTMPSEPLQIYEAVAMDHSGLDILVLPSLEYLYFFKYAPLSVESRLYYGAPTNDVNLGGFERLAREAHLDLQVTAFEPFLATHDRFLVYGAARNTDLDALQTFATAGYTMKSARPDTAGVMYEYAK